MTTLLGIGLDNRVETAAELQKILTEFGCNIRTRVGLHAADENACSNRGIILLEATGNSEKLIEQLSQRWSVQTMKFD